MRQYAASLLNNSCALLGNSSVLLNSSSAASVPIVGDECCGVQTSASSSRRTVVSNVCSLSEDHRNSSILALRMKARSHVDAILDMS